MLSRAAEVKVLLGVHHSAHTEQDVRRQLLPRDVVREEAIGEERLVAVRAARAEREVTKARNKDVLFDCLEVILVAFSRKLRVLFRHLFP